MASSWPAGCTPAATPAVNVAAWQLARAEPATPTSIARIRTPSGQRLPARLCQVLCPEFTLVTASTPAEWAELRRTLGIPEPLVTVDFSRDLVVGLLAHVGERIEPGWPIRLLSVRGHAGVARIEAAFTPGAYYPLDSAGYLELVCIHELRTIGVISINSRTFILR